jgi:basic amino acid/polyamine antiporter, APA family
MPPPSLSKQIGFWSATTLIIGSVIGSGVFMKPASMASQLGSPIWLTVVWIIAGIFSFFGALILAELGAMMPETGGIYVYFKKMFGDFVAFLYGWAAFSVINTAAVAAISYVCAWYADYFLQLPQFDPDTVREVVWHIPLIGNLYPLQDFGVKVLAVGLVIAFSSLNYVSVRAGSSFQVISTFLKVFVIGALIIGIFFSGNGSTHHFFSAENPKQGWGLISSLVVSMTGAFYAYDGWINVSFVAGEIKDPQRNIPRSLGIGTLVCILIYVIVNQAYLFVLPVEKIGSSALVASDALTIAIGNTGAAIVNALIVICTLGALNGNLMASCRITYAMGRDKVFHTWTGKTHPKFRTPGNALVAHTVWTCIFIISGTFDMLADMFVFIAWIAYALAAFGIFILRKRMPNLPRPYRVWGYPVVPILFIAFSSFYLVVTVWNDVTNYLADRQPVINSVLGMMITAMGIPLYYYFRRKKDPEN